MRRKMEPMVEESYTAAVELDEMSPRDLGTILVVEDDPRMQRILQRMFLAEHYDVVTAGVGQSALDLFRPRRSIPFVLDLILPQISGRELCQKFKGLSDDVPVIVVSAIAEVV